MTAHPHETAGPLAGFPEHIEAPRLYLRPYEARDGALLVDAGARNTPHLSRYESGNFLLRLEDEKHAAVVAGRLREKFETGRSVMIGMFDRETHAWAGQVSIAPGNDELPEFRIGYVCDVRYEGRGFVAEAVRAVLEVLFLRLGALRVCADCNENNERSWRLLERCGFTREGHLRENRRSPDGTLHGDYLYAMLRREFVPGSDLKRLLAGRLRDRLPGLAAQRRMAPVGRIGDDYDPQPPGANEAAVLLIVTDRHELLFIRRARDGRAHSGQIAFPGGAREEGDANLAETALREAEEEIGLSRESVSVLGALSPLYIGVSNFVVYPFVASVAALPPLRCQPGEVDETIPLPIGALGPARDTLEMTRDGKPYRAPTYRFRGVEIWGATAMMTAEFLEVYRDAVVAATSAPR